jgi:hypothetical protein
MKTTSLGQYFGYSVAFVSLCVGTIFLLGVFIRSTVPAEFRIMCGVIFVLLGIYRFVATYYKSREDGRNDR